MQIKGSGNMFRKPCITSKVDREKISFSEPGWMQSSVTTVEQHLPPEEVYTNGWT